MTGNNVAERAIRLSVGGWSLPGRVALTGSDTGAILNRHDMERDNLDRYLLGWEEEIRRAEEAGRERERRAREMLPLLVECLVGKYGARRVVLFGSLAEGWFGQRSDIDLAVEGIEGMEIYRAGADLDDIASPIRVDLVPIEDAFEDTRMKIERTGKILHG